MLTDEEIDTLADDVAFCDGKAEAITIIREAVRLTAERCAEIADKRSAICDDAVRYYRERYPGDDYWTTTERCAALEAGHIGREIRKAAAIREQIEDKPGWFDPNHHGRGGI